MPRQKRRFKVSVNGRSFDVEVEEIVDTGKSPIGAVPVVQKAPASAGAAAPVPERSLPGEAGVIAAPMAGKVLRVPVEVGQTVAEGELVIVLEAMKMETKVNAAEAGRIKEILVSEGETVAAGAPLVRYE